MVEKNAEEARQGRQGSHVYAILRISLFLAAFALLAGALAAAFWNRGDDRRGVVGPSPSAQSPDPSDPAAPTP